MNTLGEIGNYLRIAKAGHWYIAEAQLHLLCSHITISTENALSKYDKDTIKDILFIRTPAIYKYYITFARKKK